MTTFLFCLAKRYAKFSETNDLPAPGAIPVTMSTRPPSSMNENSSAVRKARSFSTATSSESAFAKIKRLSFTPGNLWLICVLALNNKITRTKKELIDKKKKFANAMVYLQRHKTIQEKLMFIFSADNFSQLIRRLRYIKEYSSYQKVQGEMLKQQQKELEAMQQELVDIKAKMEANLQSMHRKEQALEANKKNCQTKVAYLNSHQRPFWSLLCHQADAPEAPRPHRPGTGLLCRCAQGVGPQQSHPQTMGNKPPHSRRPYNISHLHPNNQRRGQFPS